MITRNTCDICAMYNKDEELSIFKGKGKKKEEVASEIASNNEMIVPVYYRTSHSGTDAEKVSSEGNGTENSTITSASSGKHTSHELPEQSSPPSPMEDLYDYVTTHYDFMAVDDNLYVYIKDRGFWKLIPQNDSNRELRRLLPIGFIARTTKGTLSELHEWLIVYSPQVKAEDLKKSRNYINFRNVAYDVKNDTFTADRKNLFFRYSLAIDYCGDEESSGVFEKFIATALDHDKDTIKEFRKFFALCLSNCRGLRYSFFLYGPSGTSKSTVERVLRHVIGAEHCVSLSFSQLSNDFATASLHGKHLSLSGEISDIGNKKLDVYKSITGDDLISCSYKGRDYFTLENRSVLVFATNVLPTIANKAESESMISRMVIFPFTHVVKKDACVNEYWMTLLDDLPGITAFAMKGFKDLRKDNFQFHDSKKMKAYKQDYAGENDSFSLFIRKMMEADLDCKESSERIGQAYRRFCEENDYVVLDDKQWSLILRRTFSCRKVTMTHPEKGTRVRGYKGVRLKDDHLETDAANSYENQLEEAMFSKSDDASEEETVPQA